MPGSRFHPAVQAWFEKRFSKPTPAQIQAWPSIQDGRHTLLAAPTGSGKTLAAFLAAINDLVVDAQAGPLPAQTRVLYISPLKALSNDVQKNLDEPLQGIRRELFSQGFCDAEIRSVVRTGDTPAAERVSMTKNPPHILVTTPESLYLLLTSAGGRAMLRHVRSVIVDEIHAVIGSKRGAHLALTLERLQALLGDQSLQRIGLSATQRPMEEVGRFLLGGARDAGAPCNLIDVGQVRPLDMALEIPPSPLEAVISGESWAEIYQRLAQLVSEHRTTLIFTNTRRLAERVARHLSELVGENVVTSHHGSLSKERRLLAEERLKKGELRALVATASLELGIDIGAVDLVCQIGSPRRIATFLQRAGRANHSVGGLPKARIFPLSRDELLECAALLQSIRRGELDRLIIPPAPLDILAQHIVAAVSCEEWSEDDLWALVKRAYPYRDLSRQDFEAIVHLLSEGFVTHRGRRGAFIHRDAVNRKLRARRGARLTALTNGGAIPDNADYQVILEPSGVLVGTVNEDFAVESLAGDIFQLGNASWKILRVETGRVRVEDAHGQPPSVPFWLGEAPARSDELSLALDRLRVAPDAAELLQAGVPQAAIDQIMAYLEAARAALGVMPSQKLVVLERFFDESGGMQLVLHSPFGNRVNRAWGLALRKRFCKTFNFELQAAATEDAVILSLGPMHSFPLDDVFHFLRPQTVQDVLIQAMLDSPMFEVRWRWNANRSLAVPRFVGGKKVPPQLQRMQAADLVALVFPDQAACQENIQGPREIPDHPLVQETIRDCLHEAMDIEQLKSILSRIESGEIQTLGRDLTEPSPLSQEILSARPYAFLDDAPLEERRTQAVYSRRFLDPKTASDLGALDPAAIEKVRSEAWPALDSPDDLHDALLGLGCLSRADVGNSPALQELLQHGRVTQAMIDASHEFWVATERLPMFAAVYPQATYSPQVNVPEEFLNVSWTAETALAELVRGRLEAIGPSDAASLAAYFGVGAGQVEIALVALETEGAILRGQFTASGLQEKATQWCERRLLARIHRYTLNRLRAEIEPVTACEFLRFLFTWQHVSKSERLDGTTGLSRILQQLEGFSAPAGAWENSILAARSKSYDPSWLDALSASGQVIWGRSQGAIGAGAAPLRSTPIIFSSRKNFSLWRENISLESNLSAEAERVVQALTQGGAMFDDEIAEASRLLPTQVERALGELVAKGWARSDGFSGLRRMIHKPGKSRRHRLRSPAVAGVGRWVLIQKAAVQPDAEAIARSLLQRYGVVFRKLLERENLPPWRDLVNALRKLEARGEIRGGRFVAGFSGEQFALAEAIAALREIRRLPLGGEEISLSAADPLNLVGIVTPGARVPALTKNRVLFRDGMPIAAYEGGQMRPLVQIEANDLWPTRTKLIRATYGSDVQAVPKALQP